MRRVKRRPAPGNGESFELSIETLGAQGDGIAALGGDQIFVPFTLPGERVVVRRAGVRHALPVEWRTRAADRAEPPCPHFGACGGCALQHFADPAYAGWKIGLAQQALARAGFDDVPLGPLARTPPGARRRAEFVAERAGGRVEIGFHARLRSAVVDIGACPILDPALVALVPRLRGCASALLGNRRAADILATLALGGVEIVVTASPAPDRAQRERLAVIADNLDLARLAWRTGAERSAEIIVQRRAFQATFGGVPVDLPPAAFLQASPQGEAAIIRAVVDGLAGAKRIADLYAGCGTLALPLARTARVRAVEGSAEMATALDRAARQAGIGPRLAVETRDLARRPLAGDELAGFDGAVFDPPRDGAAEQAAALAASAIPVVIAVSCNPATFARDARTLAAGGYRLTALAPIDQFLWSPHLELVGVFRR
ncbi:MAG: class I SAM-dependent RNA methyltransferase [Rhodospirillales bacterium]|nr:class I SAM-dependent RNA methyltransferase [Rhodospirillales bacterium]